jgi:uncharacterized membrane protein
MEALGALNNSTAPSNSTIIPDDEIGTEVVGGCSDDDVTDWYTGVLLSLFGNVCINFGTNLMKYGHMLRERETIPGGRKLPVSAQPRHHRRCRDSGPCSACVMPICQGWHRFWWTGIVLFVVGNGFNFVSFSYAKQSLLAALGSIQFVSNVAFGVFILGEVPRTRTYLGTATIIAGNVVIVMVADGYFGDKDAWCNMTLYTANELAELYLEPAFVVYLVVCAVVGVTAQHWHDEIERWRHPNETALGACYVLASAVVGTQSVTLTKSVSELLRDTLGGRNQLHYAFTYVVLVATAGTASFWVYRMDLALKKFDALFIIPLLQVAWTTLSIVGGGIYYKEFDDYDAFNVALFFACLSVIFFGVWLLAPREDSAENSVYEKIATECGESGPGTSGGTMDAGARGSGGAVQGGAVAADLPANPFDAPETGSVLMRAPDAGGGPASAGEADGGSVRAPPPAVDDGGTGGSGGTAEGAAGPTAAAAAAAAAAIARSDPQGSPSPSLKLLAAAQMPLVKPRQGGRAL